MEQQDSGLWCSTNLVHPTNSPWPRLSSRQQHLASSLWSDSAPSVQMAVFSNPAAANHNSLVVKPGCSGACWVSRVTIFFHVFPCFLR